MSHIKFMAVRSLVPASRDAAIILPEEDPHEALIEAMIGNISIHVEFYVAGVALSLAAWMDPDHWSEDWAKAGIEDPDAFIAKVIEEGTS